MCIFFHDWEIKESPMTATHYSALFKRQWDSEGTAQLKTCCKCGTEEAWYIELNNSKSELNPTWLKNQWRSVPSQRQLANNKLSQMGLGTIV